MKNIVDIGFRIKKIDDLLCKKADEIMKEMDVTFTQHHILVYLVHCENCTASLKQIEHEFRVSQATMAGNVKRLEEKDFITSFTLPNDKRKKMVRLTEKGVNICEKTKKLIDSSEATMRALYSEEENVKFDEYLNRLLNALDKGVEK